MIRMRLERSLIYYWFVCTMLAALAAIFVPSPVRAGEPSCDASLLGFHSATATAEIEAGIIDTSDQSVFLRVKKPTLRSAKYWTVDHEIGTGPHEFIDPHATNQRPDEARIDVSALYQTLKVSIEGAACSPISVSVVAIPKSATDTMIAIIPVGVRVNPTSVGQIILGTAIKLDNTYVSFSDTLHLTGRLLLPGKLHSTANVDLVVSAPTSTAPATLSVGPNSAGKKLTFELQNPSFGPLTIVLSNFTCVASPALECTPLASLRFPTGIVAKPAASIKCSPSGVRKVSTGKRTAGAPPDSLITVSIGSDEIFRLATTPLELDWGGQPNSTTCIILTALQIDPVGTATSATATLHYAGASGSTNWQFEGLGLRRVTDGPSYIPTGTIRLDDPQPVTIMQGLTIQHLTGSIDFGRGDGSNPTTLLANAEIAVNIDNSSTQVEASIDNLKLVITGDVLRDLQTKSFADWKPDFSTATVVPSTKGMILNHLLEKCDDSVIGKFDSDDPQTPKALQLCLGIHLTPGRVRNPDDLAYGYASFDDWTTTATSSPGSAAPAPSTAVSNPNLSAPTPNPAVPTPVLKLTPTTVPSLRIRSLAFVLPAKKPARIGLIGGSLGISALSLDFENTSSNVLGGFDTDIGTYALGRMHCTAIGVSGEATLTQITLGKETQTVNVTPRVGFGSDCTAFAVTGVLPIQLTPQSNLLLTSLAFVHTSPMVMAATPSPSSTPSPPPLHEALVPSNSPMPTPPPQFKRDLFYFKATGSYTSGNFTVFFNGIGFRTFLPYEQLPDKKASGHDCEEVGYQEYEIKGTNICAIVNVNLPMTLAATGAQNASAIEKLVSQAASAVTGFFFGKIKF